MSHQAGAGAPRALVSISVSPDRRDPRSATGDSAASGADAELARRRKRDRLAWPRHRVNSPTAMMQPRGRASWRHSVTRPPCRATEARLSGGTRRVGLVGAPPHGAGARAARRPQRAGSPPTAGRRAIGVRRSTRFPPSPRRRTRTARPRATGPRGGCRSGPARRRSLHRRPTAVEPGRGSCAPPTPRGGSCRENANRATFTEAAAGRLRWTEQTIARASRRPCATTGRSAPPACCRHSGRSASRTSPPRAAKSGWRARRPAGGMNKPGEAQGSPRRGARASPRCRTSRAVSAERPVPCVAAGRDRAPSAVAPTAGEETITCGGSCSARHDDMRDSPRDVAGAVRTPLEIPGRRERTLHGGAGRAQRVHGGAWPTHHR
jgi:hypothetical protein